MKPQDYLLALVPTTVIAALAGFIHGRIGAQCSHGILKALATSGSERLAERCKCQPVRASLEKRKLHLLGYR